MQFHQTLRYRQTTQRLLYSFLEKGYPSMGLLSTTLQTFPILNCAVLASSNFYEQAIQKITNLLTKNQDKINKNQLLSWLIICLHKTKENYSQYLLSINQPYLSQIKQYLKQFQIQDIRQISPTKRQLQKIYQQTLQKSQIDDYYNLKSLPIYLLPIKWLQSFYSHVDRIPPIDTRQLVTLMKYIDTQVKYHHYNYQIKQVCKENVHYKLISYITWKFLYQQFGGIQIKRYTTDQKQSSIQLWYRKIKIMIVQNRYIHCNQIQILVSKFDKWKQILQRIKRILISYGIVPFQSLKSLFQIFIAKKIKTNQLINLIQDQDINIEQETQLKQVELDWDIDQCQLYTTDDIAIFNIVQTDSIFGKVPLMKLMTLKPRCLFCSQSEHLFLCACGSVSFCSRNCQQSHKQHNKECKNIVKQEKQLTNLIKAYNASSRFYIFSDFLKAGKVGFQNLGNTCYMNSALQCILRVQTISQYFMKNQHLKDANVGNVLGTQGILAFSYGQLVKDYYTTNKRSLQPISVLRVIAKNPQFRGHNHQDSQQFLNYFLDKLHQDLNRVKKKPYTQEIQSNGRPDEQVSQQSWNNYLKRNQSYIAENLTGQYRSEIRCPDCKRISITFDPFMSVTLPFPKEQKSVEVTGYFLAKEGQFLKIEQTLKASTKTSQFYEKIFHVPVVGANVIDKKVNSQWKQNVSVFANKKDKGVLIFYQKLQGSQIEINLNILSNKNQLESFNRRIYVSQVNTLQQLYMLIYQNIKKPLIKAMKKVQLYDDNNQEYFKFCKENHQSIKIVTEIPQFPLAASIYTINITINRQKLGITKPISFNINSGSYEIKSQIKSKSIHDQISMSSLISCFNEPQLLTQDNTWYCKDCKDHKLAQKIMSIYRYPQYLIAHLKRFNHRGGRYVIYGEKVQTPVKLDAYEYFNKIKYQTIAIVNHFGSLTFGHYTAYVKKDVWYEYDDSSVRRVQPNGNKAYLVFYKRVQQ